GRFFTAGRKVEVPRGGTIKRGSTLSRAPALGRARPSHRLGAGEGGIRFRQLSSGPFQPTPPGRPAGARQTLPRGRFFTAGRKVAAPRGGTIKRGSSLSRPPALGRARPSHRLGTGEGGNPFRQRSSGPSPPTPPGR